MSRKKPESYFAWTPDNQIHAYALLDRAIPSGYWRLTGETREGQRVRLLFDTEEEARAQAVEMTR